MNLLVNGKQTTIGQGKVTVSRLLELQAVESPDMVSVQLNGTILPRQEFEATVIRDNDEVDFLYFMGGGAV